MSTKTMTTQEVAKQFYALAAEGKHDQIQDELYDQNAVSIEPEHSPGPSRVEGLDKIKEKGRMWNEMVEEAYGGFCDEPVVSGDYFVCKMGYDVKFKEQGRRKEDELALYKVNDQGKIISEQFFY